MAERQSNARDEGTPTVPAQKLPSVAPETRAGGAPAVPLPATLEDKPQVRGKGPKGRERRPARTRTGKSRAAPAKADGPGRAPKAATKKGVAKKGVAKKGAKKAAARKPKRPAGKPTGARRDSGGRKPTKAAGKKAVGARGATKKAGGRSPTQGGRGGTAKGKRT